MSYNPRQKYKIIKNDLIFIISKVKFPRIEITYVISKKRLVLEHDYFIDALHNGFIIELNAKTKKKIAYESPKWLQDYFIKRDKIIEDENRHKSIISK